MGNSPYCCHPFVRHIEWMRSLLFETLKPDAVNLVGHDWGAAIGLGRIGGQPERFARVVLSNTGMPPGARKRPIIGTPFETSDELSIPDRLSTLTIPF
jgi:haloalkane dehalogenase